MFPFPQLFFLLGIFFSLTLTDALAEPAPTLPSDIGAALWLKADDVQGGNGTVVTEWKSRVGNLTATQFANGSARIERKQTTGNNNAAIFFPPSSGVGDYRYFEIPSNFNLKNSTVLVSVKYEGSAVSPQVLSFLGGAWVPEINNDGEIIGSKFKIYDDPGSREDALGLYHFVDKFELTSNGTKSQSPTYTKGDWTTLSYRIDGNGNMTVSLNGGPENQTSKPNMAPQNTAGKIRIGLSGPTRQTHKENLVNAYIYEIIIFNRYLDDYDYKEVQGYMQASIDATSVQIVSLPTASSINRGELLSQSILADGSATSNGTAVAGKFKWSDGSMKVTQSGNYSAIFVPDSAKYYSSEEVQVRVTVRPELNSSPDSLTGFITLNGTASPTQSVSINGTNLTSGVVVSFSGEEGFEVSEDLMGNFTTIVNLPVTSGAVSAPLYVRLAASATIGDKPSTLSISSSGIFKSVSLSGDVINASLSYISVTPEALPNFETTAGTPSASANFTVNAFYLSENLTVNATTGFEISFGNGTFAQTLEIPLTGGNVTNALLNLRVAGSASAGPLLGSVTLRSGNKTATLSANATVAPQPVLSVTPEALPNFETTAGTPSASANFTVNAFYLSENLTVNATTGFEISFGNGTFAQTLEIPLTGGNVTNALLNLRVAGSASAGPLPGSVTLRSGNKTATLSASATVAEQITAVVSRNLPVEMGVDVALWLKADEKRAFHAGVGNGTVVSTWKSKVGNLTATQSSNQSARIEGNQTIGNNKEAVFFPPGSEETGYGYFEIPSNFNLKNSTVLVSLKYEGSAFSPRVLSFLSNNTTTAGADGISNDALALMHHNSVFRVESNYKTPTSKNYTLGIWSVLSYRIDGNGNMTVALDGEGGTKDSNTMMEAKNSAKKTRIGMSGPNRGRDNENLVNAYIYEILIFNKYLNDNQYDEIQRYMQDSMNASSVQIEELPTASLINLGGQISSPLSDSRLTGGNMSSNGTVVTGNFSWTENRSVSQSGNYSVIFEPDSAKYNLLEFEIPVIVVSVTPAMLSEFTTMNGTASDKESILISVKNLTSDVKASVDLGSSFEISTSTDNSTFGSNATIQVNPGNDTALLHVRLSAAQTSSGNKTEHLNILIGGQNATVTLKGTVVEKTAPYIKVTPKYLAGFLTTAGMPSASANFTVNAYNLLSGNLTANATTGFEIALGNGTYAQTLEIPIAGGNVTTSLNLRVAASAIAGALSGSVTLTSGNTTASLTANGTVNEPIQRTLPAPAPTPAAESPTPENSKKGKKIKKQQLKKKPKKKKKSVFSFPPVVATSGSTWITADGKVVSENQQPQSNTSK